MLSRHEKKVADELQRRGIEIFLPLITKTRKWLPISEPGTRKPAIGARDQQRKVFQEGEHQGLAEKRG
jgi:hypothetical protein